jgi:5-(carboxyamino)imidazole ribonucleotide synthase
MLGILGGGQLGRFLVTAAREWEIRTSVLDPDPTAPAGKVSDRFVTGSLLDASAVHSFAQGCEHLTIEIENVNVDALLEIGSKIPVHPSPALIRMVQDKGLQKEFYRTKGIPTADFYLLESGRHLPAESERYPLIVKLRRGGYDGRGVMKVHAPGDRALSFEEACVLEHCVAIDMEISVIAARNKHGQTVTYPPVEMVFTDSHVLDYLISPADIDPGLAKRAQEIALEIAEIAGLVGILAVEMFVSGGEILVNEIAPRPHNSGHATIEANFTSQYEQHLRMIYGMTPGPAGIRTPSALLNLLGTREGPVSMDSLHKTLSVPGVFLHMYGKLQSRPGRKMGHITILGEDRAILLERLQGVRSIIQAGGI